MTRLFLMTVSDDSGRVKDIKILPTDPANTTKRLRDHLILTCSLEVSDQDARDLVRPSPTKGEMDFLRLATKAFGVMIQNNPTPEQIRAVREAVPELEILTS